ncbi:MAG: DUF4349 domain-containing protein [Raineya sp.]|jgi:hypothetical protein|nr:DUF4349 domain-containing protein [Raineya sp.]
MKNNFKTRFWRLFAFSSLSFVVLFVFRLVYGYLETDTNHMEGNHNNFFSSIENTRKNYASEKKMMNNTNVQEQANIASSQKFEKTASIQTKSSEFEKDEKNIKAKTKEFNAVIQYEQNLGQKGNRQVHLLIGVNPSVFDAFYAETQKIGLVKSMQITKVDKTNEYKQLNAKKASLEKTLQSLLELKSRTGQITDFVALHDKILDIERQLQELGVELGNFDVENEFCTVKFSLYEGETQKKISLIHRVKVALEWTIKYFAVFMFSVILLGIAVFIILLVIDKFNLIKVINNKINE